MNIYDVNESLTRWSPLRKCLMWDEVPAGAEPRYDAPHNGPDGGGNVIYLSGRDAASKQCTFSGEFVPAGVGEFLVPTVQFSASSLRTEPGVAESDLKGEFLRYEQGVMGGLLSLLPSVVRRPQFSWEDDSGVINSAFRTVEQHDLVVSTMLMNRDTFERLARTPEMRTLVYCGALWTADAVIMEHPHMENRVYCLSSKEYVGAAPCRDPLQTLWSPQPDGSTVAYYDVGAAILNDFAVSCAELRPLRERLAEPRNDAEIKVV
jgi:hypothetical protein